MYMNASIELLVVYDWSAVIRSSLYFGTEVTRTDQPFIAEDSPYSEAQSQDEADGLIE